ncbi:hypothetical protein KCTC32516_01699 [Polaribacter huanghezhanensis]|uniref:DUF6503 family protein n=1 Tax=Polaribacter huanghezhanensis TaxID=1354726 RepID=UPI00264A3EE8|nr:DUF6503 family protein [Polaribacter huanghezhanensis]WKD86329.1 hypothetical protein KCTC32516_01699 [Polaribacter huanghezhanensis]
MKKILLLFVLAAISISCKNEEKKETKKENFPNELAKVFEKHGGIEAWKKAKTLSFNKGDEVYTTDLQSRKIVVKAPNYSLGFDGKEVWLSQKDSTAFKGNKNFYYNLYFYFYAMPFVLADDGIMYEKTTDLVFDGVSYPGFKISYKANIGSSPDDNYLIYYNKDSYQMEWLAYTVTFNSKKPSEKYSIIRYNDWNSVSSLLLPKSITWYNQDSIGAPTEPKRAATEFTLPLISDTKISDSFFEKPTK